MKQTDILINTLRIGDATAEHTFHLARTLRGAGHDLALRHNFAAGPLPADMAPIATQTHPADYRPSRPLTILEYPLWFPLAERFRAAAGTAIFWYHGVTAPSLWSPEAGRDLLVNSRIRTELALYAHLAVATSPFTADELHRHSGMPRDRIRVVPLGIPLAPFQPHADDPKIRRLRSALGLEGKRVLLYVGRMAAHKRIDLLIRTLALLCADHANVHLLLVGDIDSTVETRAWVEKLKTEVAQQGVADRVTFTGRVDAVAPYYALADLYLQASQHEGFGVPLVEAMASGLPVIATDSGAMPWVLGADASGSDEPGGLLVESGAAEQMAIQAHRVLTDADLRRRLARQAVARAARFDLHHFQSNALAAIDEAIARRAEGTPAGARGGDGASVNPLFAAADIAMHEYRVRSRIPLIGPLLAWLRTQSTTHLKEAYIDRVVEQQVNCNRALARELADLRRELADLRRQAQHTQPPSTTHPDSHPCK